MNPKPLLAHWHAVDLEQVTDSLKTIPCDQLHISYFKYPYPHIIAEDFFHAHKEYTHLILLPNDLVFTKDNYESMLKTIETNDYDVFCGVCNVDIGKYRDKLNITSNLPVIGPYYQRRYFWISKNKYPNIILKVPFAGFPAMWVKRQVLEQTRINWLSPQLKGKNHAIWENQGGYSNDLAFCHNLNQLGIPIYCDTSVNMVHLRYQGVSQIGKKPPKVKFIPYYTKQKHDSQVQVCSLRTKEQGQVTVSL